MVITRAMTGVPTKSSVDDHCQMILAIHAECHDLKEKGERTPQDATGPRDNTKALSVSRRGVTAEGVWD